jgi:hypothetical protein
MIKRNSDVVEFKESGKNSFKFEGSQAIIYNSAGTKIN